MGYKYKKNKDGTITIVTTEDEEFAPVKNKDGSVSVSGGSNQNVRFEDDDIAPSRQTTTEAPVKEEKEDRSWFKKPAVFEDGYQFGDIFKTVEGTSRDLGENVMAGILGIGEAVVDAGAYVAGGVGKLFGADEFAEDTKEFIANDLYDEKEVAKKILDATTFSDLWAKEENSVLGDKTDSLVQSGGQLLGTVALQAVGVPWFVTTGTTSFGSEVEQAFGEDATYEEAGLSAAISAGAEILTEKLSGGINFGAGTLDDVLTKQLVTKIADKAGRTALKLGLDVVGEGGEEVISQFVSTLGQQLTYEKEDTWKELLTNEEAMDAYIAQVGESLIGKEAREAYKEAFIGGAVLGGVSSGGKAIGSAAKGIDATSGLTANEEAVFKQVYDARIAEAQENGEKLSLKDKSKIYDEVMEDLEKGNISIEDIEGALGGEAYTEYQNAVAEEETFQKEYDELYRMKNGEKSDEQIDRQAELKRQLDEIKATDRNTQLKTKLSEDVFKLAKGTKLVESYNEQTRKGEAYTADVSKYDVKQKETVQKAIDSGILNNSRRTHEFVDIIAKISADKGVSFNFTDNAKLKESGFALDGKEVNGFVTKDGVTLNMDSHKAWQSTVGHEITHVLEGTELYGELQSAIKAYAETKGEYKGKRDALTELYKDVDADIDAELTADLVGEYLFTDSDFVNNLSTKHRNVFHKIYDEIKYLVKVATAGSKEARQLEKVKRAFDNAYKVEGKSEGTKYSISDSDGKQLTAEQSEYFKDSKIKDKDGNLLKLYHGTMADFTEFDIGMSGDNYNGWSEYGQGVYLTPDAKMAQYYADNVGRGKETKIMELYANVTNPFNTMEAVEFDITDIKQKYELTDFDEAFIKKAGYRLVDFLKTHKEDVRSYLTGKGYDGVWDMGYDGELDQVVVYNANQVKNTDNAKPTADPDIRYSLSDSDGKKLTKEQSEYFKNSKMRDDNGNLKVMYHGSQDAGFHTFESRFSDDDISFFFVDRNDVATTYSGSEEVYEARTIRSAEDMNKFLEEIDYDHYEVVERNGKFELLENNEHVAWSDTAQGIYKEFCWYEGVGEGDANYKVYLNLTNPLEIDAKGRPWNKIDAEFSQEVYNRFNSLTPEEKSALIDLAEWEDFSLFNSEIQTNAEYASALEKLGEDFNKYDLYSIATEKFSEESLKENSRYYLKTRDFAKRAKEQGYDGVVFKNILDGGPYSSGDEGAATVAVAFSSEQIKSVANEKPTADADIRYSLSEEGEAPIQDRGRTPLRDMRLNTAEDVAPVADTVGETPIEETVEETYPEGFAPISEDEANALSEEALSSLTDADAPDEAPAPYYESENIDPFEDRKMKEVSKDRKVNAYQYDNPEVKPFFQEEANILLGELQRTQKPETIYNGWTKYNMTYEAAQDIPDVYRTPRMATESIEYLRDTVEMSYADIEKGLKAIIEDEGAENIAAAKKIEFIINNRLLYGYTVDGLRIPPNQDYINLLEAKHNEEKGAQITAQGEEAAEYLTDDIAPYEVIEAEYNEAHKRAMEITNRKVLPYEKHLYKWQDDFREASAREDYWLNKLMEREGEDVAPVAEKYEAIRPEKPKAEPTPEPRMKRVDSTNNAPDGMEERKWYGTSTSSKAVDGIVTPDEIPDEVRYYKVKANKDTLATANARLAKDGYAKSREYFEGRMAEKKLTVEDIALGERLIQEAAKAGDAKAVRDLIIDVSILGTELGQRVQALSMIRRLTPEGQLRALTRTVERGKSKGDPAFKDVEITEEMADTLTSVYNKASDETVQKLQNEIGKMDGANLTRTDAFWVSGDTYKYRHKLKELGFTWNKDKKAWYLVDSDGTFDQAELDRAVEDVKQQIADQMKVTKMDKVNAWRYLSMLGNPKTHLRNIFSNVAMLGTRAVKNVVARSIEDIAPIENRTKTWRRASEAVKAFAKQTMQAEEAAIKGDNKYSDEGSIKAKRQIFKNKALNAVDTFNKNAMEAEDAFFSKIAYKRTLQEYLTANGIKTEADIKNNPELVAKAKDYALEEARRATFRQDSFVANKIAEIERKNPVYGAVIGSTIPFKKTPINIAKTGLAYSPLGIARNIYDAVQVKKGNMDASEAIDHVAQTLTGTSLAIVGYTLASLGVLNGAGDDDKEGKYDYQLGKQSYSFTFGGDTYSLSWLSPVAMPLFVGVNAYETLVEQNEWDANVVFDTLGQTLDPLSEMSFLSSLDDVLSSYDSGADRIFGMAGSMAQNYATQFIPTLSSQLASTFDDTKRSTKASKDSGFAFGEETVNKMIYKIPGLRNTLEPTTDIWGNEVKQTENFFARGFESFFSPANKRAGIYTAVDEEIKDLYRQTDDTGVIPSIPYNYINYDGEKYEMSASEHTEYKKLYGQTAYDLMSNLFDTNTYKNATSEEKADMVNRVYDYARDEAKRAYFSKLGVDYTNAEEEGKGVFKENPIKGAIEADLPVDEYSFSTEYPEKYNFFKQNGISYETYKNADEDGKRAYSWAYENPGKYTLSKAVSDDFLEYYGLRGAMNDFDAKDENGETVSGLKKERVIEYVNGLDLDYGQKIILFRSMYSSKEDRNNYNADIVEYLNNREDISYEEMVTILKELDMTVHSNGRVTWD